MRKDTRSFSHVVLTLLIYQEMKFWLCWSQNESCFTPGLANKLIKGQVKSVGHFYMDFGKTIRLIKLGTFIGLKCPWSGNSMSLKRVEHPTLLQVLRRCLKGTYRASKGDAVGSKHLPSCVLASGVFFRQTLVWVLFTQFPVALLECYLFTGRFQLKVSQLAWRKAW